MDHMKGFIWNITRIKSWWKLPTYAAVGYLAFERETLRRYNLYDSYDGELQDLPKITCTPQDIVARTLDGRCNNIEFPPMGMVGYRLGRNMPFKDDHEDLQDLLAPNPRYVANKLLVREKFIPATTINLLAAAWIQFQVHDWFNHGRELDKEDIIHVPLPADDRWRADGIEVLDIPKSQNDTRRGDNPLYPTTFGDTNTHWWDLSQVYSTTPELNAKLRTLVDGKLKVDDRNLLTMDTDGMELTGFKKNWWLGLTVMHTIFTREHNAICDYLKKAHPTFTDQELYDKARLVVTAINAKVHTVEWTPSLLQDKIGYTGLNGEWFGIKTLINPFLAKFLELLPQTRFTNEIINGAIGSPPRFDDVPFALTEEFVSVYRFHSLLPDEITIVDSKSGLDTGIVYPLLDTTFTNSPKITHSHPFADIIASFGTANPGALTLHNFPAFLTNITLPDDRFPIRVDMATTDIVRDRERGCLRYNSFRRNLWLKPAETFEDINPDPTVAKELRELYNNDIEMVDLLIGALAEEPRPPNWAFGDTVFHIFLLMASRRLTTDRFLTNNFTAEFYTQEGLDWVKNTTFKDVLLRAEPSLAPFLQSVDNPFKPWVYGETFQASIENDWVQIIVMLAAGVIGFGFLVKQFI